MTFARGFWLVFLFIPNGMKLLGWALHMDGTVDCICFAWVFSNHDTPFFRDNGFVYRLWSGAYRVRT